MENNRILVEDADEPKGRVQTIDWADIAEQVKKRNGGWTKLPDPVHSTYAYRIRKGLIKSFPEGEFDATVRQIDHVEKNKGILMIRWMGPQS